MHTMFENLTKNMWTKSGGMLALFGLLFANLSSAKPAIGVNETKIPTFEQKVTVYPWNNHFGLSTTVTLNEAIQCADIPKLWQQKISSVNTQGTCAMLCSKKNCKGKCIKISPGSPSHNRLRDLAFDKKAVSVGTCYGVKGLNENGTTGKRSGHKSINL